MAGNPFRAEVVARLGRATGLDESEIDALLTYPPDLALGDLAFPCFTLAKTLRKPPAAIASELAGKLLAVPAGGEGEAAGDLLAAATAAGPYLNVSFDRAAFARWVLSTAMEEGEAVADSDEGRGKTIAIDYSSPNIAKPFHVGHLRSTIIGGALYRIFRKLGYHTVGINHIGDWGTQFGKLIVALKRWGEPADIDDIMALNRLYVRFHEEEKKDPSLTEEARDWFRRQEAGDPEALDLWTRIRERSLEYVKEVYDRIGIEFDAYTGESFFNDKMEDMVTRAREAGLTKVSDGALIVDLQEHGIDTPALLKKADGSTLYITRDLAAAYYRKITYDFDKLLYVVGAEQSLHFEQLFKLLDLMGFEWARDCVHVKFGRVIGMATRQGNVVYLEELLDEARERALRNMREHAEKRPEVEDEERVAEVVGIAAIFFSDLSNRRIKDYRFDWDRAISFEGDTGPYLLNAHARIAGIIRKCGVEPASRADEVAFETLVEPEAHRLLALLPRYGDALRQAARDYEPSTVATYLLDLARALHSSYQVLRVKGEEEGVARARLQLFLAVKHTLASGLGVLGIPALERM